jgi:hypothetical protein
MPVQLARFIEQAPEIACFYQFLDFFPNGIPPLFLFLHFYHTKNTD